METGEIREKPWNAQERLTWTESVTMATAAHPDIAAGRSGRSCEAVCPGAPRAPAGWEKTDPQRRGRTPKPPRTHPHLMTYAQMAQVLLEDYRHGQCG